MNSKTIEPLKTVFGIDEKGNPITFGNIIDEPFEGWGKIETFTHSGAMAFLAARLYHRLIPEHKFFKNKNSMAVAPSLVNQEVSRCQH
jgi:hypothetical protein